MQAHQPSRVAGRGCAVLRVTCEHPEARLPSEYAGCGENFLRTKQAIQIRDQCQLGWMGATCSRRLPRSHHVGGLLEIDARGRSDLHSPNDAWTSQAHDGPGIRQDRRGMNAASSPFRQNGISRPAATGRSGFREQIDGLGWPRAKVCIATRDPRDECSAGGVTGRPRYDSARRAKVGFGGEYGNSRAARADGAGVWAWNRRIRQLARMR